MCVPTRWLRAGWINAKDLSSVSRNRLVPKCRPVFTNVFGSLGRKTALNEAAGAADSLFQSKDEPEGSEGQANWGRLLSGIEIKFRLAVVAGAEGMWESAVSIPKVGGKPDRICLLRASLDGLSTNRHFLGPLRWLAVLRGQS